MLSVRLLTGTVALLTAVAAHGALLVNGSFEDPAISVVSSLDFSDGRDPVISIPGWASTSSGSGYSQNFLYSTTSTNYSDGVSDGTQAILLNGDGTVTTTLSQTFATVLGTTYQVLFDMSIQSSASNGETAPLSLQATGGVLSNYVYTAGSPVAGTYPFQTMSYLFTAASNSTTLTFTQVGGGVDSPLLDNVRANATPEPGSIAIWGGLFIAAALAVAGRKRC